MNAKEIVLSWKLEIEAINIRGYSRKVTDIDCFKMNKYYTGEGVLTDCFKVNFGFEDGFTQNPCNEIYLNQDEFLPAEVVTMSLERDEWNKTLEEHFISKFGKVIDNTEYGDLLFHNEICDYMVNQGHRFIIQFYLPGVISKLREEKLNQLIN